MQSSLLELELGFIRSFAIQLFELGEKFLGFEKFVCAQCSNN